MSDDRNAWADAFLRQGASDLDVYELLAAQATDVCPRCHALHYLQMACEKIGKAYRIRDTNAALHGEGGLLRRHVGFEKFMSSFLLSPSVTARYQDRDAQLRLVRKTTRALAREIEKLAPAVNNDSIYASPTVGWMTYLDSGEYPRVPGPLDGMRTTAFADGTLMELTARPWDPDNRRVTSFIVAAYEALDEAGVLIPPKHVRDVIGAGADEDDDEDEDDDTG